MGSIRTVSFCIQLPGFLETKGGQQITLFKKKGWRSKVKYLECKDPFLRVKVATLSFTFKNAFHLFVLELIFWIPKTSVTNILAAFVLYLILTPSLSWVMLGETL